MILIDHLIKEGVSWYDRRSKANFFHSSMSIIAGDQLSESRLFSDVILSVLKRIDGLEMIIYVMEM